MPRGATAAGVRAVNPILTQWMVVQADKDDAYIADLAFMPTHRPGESTGTIRLATSDFKSFSNQTVDRAAGGPYEEVGLNLTSTTYTTRRYGVQVPVNDDLRSEHDAPMSLERLATLRAMREVQIRREVRVAAAMFVTGVWTTETTLGAAAQWDDPGGDPLGNLWTMKRGIKLASAADAKVGIMGWDTFRVAVQNGDITSLMPSATRQGQITLSELAQRLREAFEIEKLFIGRAIRNTAVEGDTESNAFIWTDNFALVNVPDGDLEAPAFAQIASTVGGPTVVTQFRREETEDDVVRVKENRDEIVIDADQGALLINTAN